MRLYLWLLLLWMHHHRWLTIWSHRHHLLSIKRRIERSGLRVSNMWLRHLWISRLLKWLRVLLLIGTLRRSIWIVIHRVLLLRILIELSLLWILSLIMRCLICGLLFLGLLGLLLHRLRLLLLLAVKYMWVCPHLIRLDVWLCLTWSLSCVLCVLFFGWDKC
jgi:hypothetical protein